MPFTNVRGQKVYYEVGGEGETIILIHGSFADADVMEAPATALASGFRALRFDRRGHGRSAPSLDPVSLAEEAEDVAQLADWFSSDAVHLVSHDDGAEIAIQFALEHPGRTRSLALIAPTVEGFPWSPEALAFRKDFRRAFRMNPRKAIEERWLTTPAFDALKEHEAHFDRIADIYRHSRPAGGSMERPAHPGPFQIVRLAEIRVPTAILIGGRDEADRWDCASAISNMVPGCTWLEFPTCGRFPHVEESRALISHLMDFYLPEGDA